MTETSIGKKIFFTVITVLLAGLLLEGAAFLLSSILTGKPLSPARCQAERRQLIGTGAPGAGEGETAGAGAGYEPGHFYEVIHPYLGYVRDPTRMPDHNEYGFPGKESPIEKRSPGRLIIGIFGGSFAEDLAREGGDTLVGVLGASPLCSGREIVIRPIAIGGYKQPQQLLALAYLLSLGAEFDIVIAIDGFNEVVLTRHENLPKGIFPFFPRGWYAWAGGTANPALLKYAGRIALLDEARRRRAVLFSAIPLRYSPLANTLWKYLDNRTARKKRMLETDLQEYEIGREEEPGYAVTGPRFRSRNKYRAFAEVWKNAGLQMDKLCRANGIMYLHFLQPNQHLPGSKPIGPEEAKAALQGAHPVYREAVRKGYPYLIRAGEEMKSRGVDFTI